VQGLIPLALNLDVRMAFSFRQPKRRQDLHNCVLSSVPEELGIAVQEAQVVKQGLVRRVGAQAFVVAVDVLNESVDARCKVAKLLQSSSRTPLVMCI
jgi:hypothetical protein